MSTKGAIFLWHVFMPSKNSFFFICFFSEHAGGGLLFVELTVLGIHLRLLSHHNSWLNFAIVYVASTIGVNLKGVYRLGSFSISLHLSISISLCVCLFGYYAIRLFGTVSTYARNRIPFLPECWLASYLSLWQIYCRVNIQRLTKIVSQIRLVTIFSSSRTS